MAFAREAGALGDFADGQVRGGKQRLDPFDALAQQLVADRAAKARAEAQLQIAPRTAHGADDVADVITKAPMLASRVLRSLVDGPKSVSEIAAALGTAKGGGAFPTSWRS